MELNEIKNKSLKTVKSFLSRTIRDTNILNQSWEADDIQGVITIDEIQDGLVFTSDGRIVSMVEIMPVNYFDYSVGDREYMADNFGAAFKILPDSGQFKIMSVATNLNDYESMIRNATAHENSPLLKKRVDNYLEVMRLFQREGNSISKRFFYIYEYEGNESKQKTDDYAEILKTMRQTQQDVIRAFREMGNIVIDMQSNLKLIAEVFYQFYNPKSSREEDLSSRISKIQSTAHWFGQNVATKDCICPRGVRFGKWDYAVIDGIYHTYFVLRENSYPLNASTAWPVVIMNAIDDGDMDIYYRKNLSAFNDFITDRTDVISRGMAHTYDNSDSDRGNDYWDKSQNAKLMKELQKTDDVYDVCMIVTLRAKTFEDLNSKRISFLKAMKKMNIAFDSCYLRTQFFFDMVTPIHSVNNKIFKTHKRNITNTGLASFYFFAAFEMFDRKGYWLGYANNGTLFGFDNYNTKLYSNPHITILGKTGAGKTVTQLHIVNVMRMMGMRTILILPLKGHEYKDNVESMNGQYIPLFSTDVCINVCEIRPAEILNEENCRDNEERMEALKEADSLLSLKVQFLINWIRIQLDEGDRLTSEEEGELNTLLVRMYNSRGITDDNLSIYETDTNGRPTTQIKEMPIIEDICNAVTQSSYLKRLGSILNPWVHGSLKHMNGQTNIDLNNKCIAFDVNEDKLGRYLPAFMLIGFEMGYAIASRDMEERCCIVLDETWKFLREHECAKYIFKMEKILRSYSTTLMCATQQITDCMRNEDAKAMLSMPDIKIILKTDKQEIPMLNSIISMSDSDIAALQSFKQGQGFYCYGNSKMQVQFVVPLLELYLDEPKESQKQRYKEMMNAGQLVAVS